MSRKEEDLTEEEKKEVKFLKKMIAKLKNALISGEYDTKVLEIDTEAGKRRIEKMSMEEAEKLLRNYKKQLKDILDPVKKKPFKTRLILTKFR